MKFLKKAVFYSLFILLSYTVVGCPFHNYIDSEQDSTDLKERATKLKRYYIKAQTNDIKYQKLFFDTFPTSFEMFDQLYGYEENTFHLLYDEAHKHVRLFCELRKFLDKKEYYEKLVRLGLHGHWNADAINYLQHCMVESSKEDLKLLSKILDRYSDKEIESYWYFLFDGPHPPKIIPIDIPYLRKFNSRIAYLAESAFQRVLVETDEHGK